MESNKIFVYKFDKICIILSCRLIVLVEIGMLVEKFQLVVVYPPTPMKFPSAMKTSAYMEIISPG